MCIFHICFKCHALVEHYPRRTIDGEGRRSKLARTSQSKDKKKQSSSTSLLTKNKADIINDSHKDTLVSGDLMWEPQTNTMIYATNKESERWYNNNSTRPYLSTPFAEGEDTHNVYSNSVLIGPETGWGWACRWPFSSRVNGIEL